MHVRTDSGETAIISGQCHSNSRCNNGFVVMTMTTTQWIESAASSISLQNSVVWEALRQHVRSMPSLWRNYVIKWQMKLSLFPVDFDFVDSLVDCYWNWGTPHRLNSNYKWFFFSSFVSLIWCYFGFAPLTLLEVQSICRFIIGDIEKSTRQRSSFDIFFMEFRWQFHRKKKKWYSNRSLTDWTVESFDTVVHHKRHCSGAIMCLIDYLHNPHRWRGVVC